jgi:hypothetical protein
VLGTEQSGDNFFQKTWSASAFPGALVARRARDRPEPSGTSRLHSAANWYWIVPVGGRFWVGLLASIVGIGIAAAILFLVVADAFIQWGVLGALIVFCGIVLVLAAISDRRKQARYDDV